MRFDRCLISRPGLFDGLEIRFSEGINIISGRNGSGKTLLARTMMECAWQPSGPLRIFNGEAAGDIYSEVNFTIDSGQKYKAVRNQSRYYRLDRDDASGPAVLYREPHDPASDDNPAVSDEAYLKLNKIFERIPAEIFESVSYCSSPTDDMLKNIPAYEIIKKILLDDHSGFYPFISIFGRYWPEPPAAARIQQNETTIRDISRKVQIIEIQNTRRSKLTQERDRVLAEIGELNAEAERINDKILILRTVMTDMDSMRSMKDDLDSIKTEVSDEEKKIASMTTIKKDIERLFPQFKHLDRDDPGYLDSLQEIFLEIRNINEKIETFRHKSDGRKSAAVKAVIAAASAAAAAAVFAAIEFPAGHAARNIIFISAGSAAAAAAVSLLVFMKVYPKKTELDQLLAEKESVEARLKVILEKGHFHIEGYKLSELYEFLLQYFEDYIEYVDINTDLKKLETEIRGAEYISSTGSRLSELASREKELMDKTGALLDKAGISIENISDPASIEYMINTENGNLAGIIIRTDEKKAVVSRLDEDLVQCSDINDEFEALSKISGDLEKETSLLRNRIKALGHIGSSLKSAAERREKLLVRKLIKRIHDTFHEISENQHISEIDDTAIENIIRRGELPTGLNLGTSHLLLMTIKLCLSDFLIDSNMSLPLIIDEPFHFLDSQRVERLRKVIEETALKRQIIILTHHNGMDDWGNYVELK